MAITKADTEYRHKVIVPRYLAGEKAERLAKELKITESALRQWFHREQIYRFGPGKKGSNLRLSRWARRAFSPCADAIRAADPEDMESNETLAQQLGYTAKTIRQTRKAMEFVNRHKTAR